MENETVEIAYGAGYVPLRLDPNLAAWDVFRPQCAAPLADARASFIDACRGPIGTPPLRTLVSPDDRVVIVTSDGTRPVPNRLLIPWLLEELEIAAEQVTVLLGTGTHRANTAAEIEEMFGADLAAQLTILNHDARDEAANALVGTTTGGIAGYIDRHYLEADKRIVLGFIEPHFFAGFSGGAKGVAPGVAGLETTLQLHRYDLIADPRCTWGEFDDNPIQREIAEIVAFCSPEFLVNVTLNLDKAITGIFAGDYRAAHRAGRAQAKAESMVPVDARYPVVVTSNSGFPLDQNLYQAVKGMSAAARIVEAGGTIIVASECRDGFPEHGDFRRMLCDADSPAAVEQFIRELDAPTLDQWQVQILVTILRDARVSLYSSMPKDWVAAAMLTPTDDLQECVEDAIREHGAGCRVAVLPDGPLTIPYLRG